MTTQTQNQIHSKPKIIYIEPRIALKSKDKVYYNPELAIIQQEKISIMLINCDGGGYSKDYIIKGENISIKTINEVRNSYCVMRTVEVEPWHSDEPATFARVREVFSNKRKSWILQTYLYYNGKWYVFTYEF